MPRARFRHVFVAVLLLVSLLAQGTWALAGTTGGISGSVHGTDGAAVSGAKVTVTSPSETTSTMTDAGGNFSFLALAPDSYTVSVTKTDYADQSLPGVTVFADQVQTLAITMPKSLKTIVSVRSNSANNLVKSGTTSDVYSVNAATQQVVASSGGGNNLNSAYSAIYQQPGVTSYVGNYGWGQVFYIRGSAYSQVGYEFDGVPVNRAFDNYQANSLSNLGQQELQVYTGGSPSGASSATLGGFINQVIKTGTYPGSGTLKGGLGGPAFFHELVAEAGGANPSRTFSYYVGLNGYNAMYPYWNSSQGNNIANNGFSQYGFTAGADLAPLYGALYGVTGLPDGGNYAGQFGNGPWPACQNGGVNGGLPVGATQANPGPFGGACLGYGVYGGGYGYYMEERNTVMNFHFAIPHKMDGGRDDLQILYDNSMQNLHYNSDINSNGGLAFVSGYLNQFAPAASGPFANTSAAGLCGYENVFGYGCAQSNSPIPYSDTLIFAPGTQFGQPAASAHVVPYYFPNTSSARQANNPFTGNYPTGLPVTNQDGQWNDVGIVKLQYTKNMGQNAYARLFGYSFYSDWLNSGPDCGTDGYLLGFLPGGLCGNTPDYELGTHTRGAELQLADQINPQNLLQFTANYTTASVARFNNSSWEAGYAGSRTVATDLTNGDPNNPMCFSPSTGAQNSCFSSSQGNFGSPTRGQAENPCGVNLAPNTPACLNNATWEVTVPGGQGTFNTVKPVFTSFALQDEFRPNSRWDLNIGARYENYRYDLTPTNTPDYAFWFNAAAEVQCFNPANGLPALTPLVPGEPVPPSPVQTNPFANCNAGLPSGLPQYVHPIGATLAATPQGAACVTAGYCSATVQYSSAVPGSIQHGLISPRIGGTYTMGPNDVFRFSVGKYTQPTETAFEEYLDQSAKRAAAFNFSQFWGLGFNTPAHDNPVQYSNNFDFSLEHRFANTDWSMKVSPFYRDTHNEIVSLVLGPGFVSGVNVGHQHSYGVELAVSKGDPTRDGLSGQLAYTYTKALVQYGNLPNGTNGIDYLNNYIKAFNALTSGGGGAQCYQNGAADASCTDIDGSGAGTVIKNPYYNMSQQGLLDREGYYPTYPNEPPNDPGDQGGSSAIAPHDFSGWLQWKHGKLAIAPNFELISGTYYGSPTDTYGIDPRSCAQNESAAVDNNGNPIAVSGAAAQNCDFLTAAASPYVQSGYLAIPNPYTGKMDSVGQYQEPWILNVGALIRYDISPKITANLSLASIFNRCFGGSNTAWSTAFKPNNYVCGYGQNNGNYLGATSNQPGFGGGFFYGNSPSDAVNGGYPVAPAYSYPFGPSSGAEPFQAYLELQIKL